MQGLKMHSLGFLAVAKLQLIVPARCSFVLSGDLLVGKPTDEWFYGILLRLLQNTTLAFIAK